MIYNNFCKEKQCPNYVEWSFNDNGGSSWLDEVFCVSCKLVGQSYDIHTIPESCEYLEEIKDFKKKQTNREGKNEKQTF